MLLVLVLCALCPAALSTKAAAGDGPAVVHAVSPETRGDRHEQAARNYVSAHELPKDVATRVKIVGDLGTPPPGVPLDFVPQQSYVQVRRYDAVKRLPQEAALEEAATAEEAANAPRLREVVSHKKTQEVYEEQGYEDAGYDHGGSKKLKIEEEVKDTHNVDVIRSNNSSPYSAQETKESTATVAPSGRGTWSRHKSSSGRKTRFEDDGGRGKLTTKESTPTSENTSGNFTKFDGGRTIVVQNLTSTEKKDHKDSAESRQVSSVSKTATDKVEPTTYRPAGRHEGFRHSTKPQKNDGQKRNRPRNRPRKNNDDDAEHQQSHADVVGSYDNTPWVPIDPPKDWSTRPQFETKKHLGKSKVNSEMFEPGGHGMRFGFTVHHDNPYQYVYPAEASGHAAKQPAKPIRFKPEISEVIMGKPKGPPVNYFDFTPETNYDGSAIYQKPKKPKATGSSSTDQINLSTTSNFKDPVTKYKPDSTHSSHHEGSAIRQRPKTKPVQQEAFVEYINSYPKPESPRNEKNKGHRDIESELGISANSGSRYIPSDHGGHGSNTKYESPFYTKRPKPAYNTDTMGDYNHNVHEYPKFELYPGTQNKFAVKEKSPSSRPSVNLNTGTSEFSYVPPRVNKYEGPRLSEYPKFNNRPKNVYRESLESSESWENYPKTKPVYQSSEESYSKRGGNSEEYPKFDNRNKGGDNTRSKSNHMYRLVPYQKQTKLNNMYSYVQHDDHYPSGSHQSSVKTEAAAPSSSMAKKDGYVNNRHPFLPKDSLKNSQHEHKSEDDNTKHVENLTLAHFAGLHKSNLHRPLPIEYNERVNNLAKLLNDNYPRSRTRRDLEVIHIASSGTTTEIPVDTVVYPNYKHAPKQSAIRYATNPNLKPRKTEGGMEFYESTDKVRCDDVSGPADVVPERTEDGEWKGEPRPSSPKVEAVGDKIGCFKKKFFGEDPLDNPFFKEKTVGFPDVLYSEKKPLRNQENVDPNLDWNFAEELIPGQWFPDKDKRTRRSGNESLPNNHKIQGMDSILPEPIILTFPTKSTTVVYNVNETKYNTENRDTEGSSNQEHVLKYYIKHPSAPLGESTTVKNHLTDSKIFGLVPPPQLKKKPTNPVKLKTPSVKKLLKKIKVEDDSDEDGLLDVLSPISLFLNDDDYAAPVVHNFFNIKMSAPAMLQTNTMVDGSSGENLNQMYLKNYRRQKRNMQGVDLEKPRQRNINYNANTNLTVSPGTSRVRMYSTDNGTWFRNKRDQTSVNVDVRRKEPRYYYHTPRPRVRVKRVVHNPPPVYSKSGQVFSSKYLIPDQDKGETLPEEINVAFSTAAPKHNANTQFIPAIAFGDSKTKVIQYNDSVANSTNGVERAQIDRNNSLIYVINPDTGVGKWMQVIKVKNDQEDARSSFGHGPIYLEKKIKTEDRTRHAIGLNGPTFAVKQVKKTEEGGDGPVVLEKKVKDGLAEETVGKFGFKGLDRDFIKNIIKSPLSHRFALKDTLSKAPWKGERSDDQPKKVICPVIIKQKKKKEMRRRTTTTEIPVVEEAEEGPVEQSGEEESPEPQEEDGGGEGEGERGGEEEDAEAEKQNEEDHPQQPEEQNESDERPEENEQEDQPQDQDVHESKRKKPFSVAKKPTFYGYHLHPRQRRKQNRE